MITSGLPNFIWMVCWKNINFTFKTSVAHFQNSIRAHVGHRAFETFQIELYRVVDYDSKWPANFHEYCMLEFYFIFTFKTSFDKFLNSIRAHVCHRAFATLQIELYRVVDYDSKWPTNFHEDCMLEILLISLLRRLLREKNSR